MPVSSASRPSRPRRLAVTAAAAAATLLALTPTASASTSPEPAIPTATAHPTTQAMTLDGLIDPGALESVQQSIVGIVVTWEEPADPYAWATTTSGTPESMIGSGRLQPAVAVCTGWFDSPTTIVTAGHCVDPAEGRQLLDLWNGLPTDPQTGLPAPVPAVRPDPKRTVYAFQPRELPGAVLTAPTIVRVDDFRAADEGDTARLEVYGTPPAKPLPVAPDAPRLGDPITSIGFPGLNIADTDGIDLHALLAGNKSPAKVLQDSRLQPANTSGTIIARQYRQGVAVYQVSADFDHGMSGGPTLNNRGQVIGINSQMTIPFLGQNFNIITDTATLRRYLAHDTTDHRTQPELANVAGTRNHSERPDDVPTEWIALAAVLVAASVGFSALWWARRRRVNSSVDTETHDRSTTTDPTAASDSAQATEQR